MVTLGNIDQWILIRGSDKRNPVLLFLHGGPGAPLFTYAREIGVGANLEKNFVMVYWEQRGTGKSFSTSIPPESMSIEQLVSDTQELTRLLRQQYDKNKIFLLGRSFGSLIGILSVSQSPAHYFSYISIAQMVNPMHNDSASFQYTLKLAREYGNNQALDELEDIGFPPYGYKKVLIQRKWLTFFSEKSLRYKLNKKNPQYRKKLLSTPEYSMIDVIWMGLNPFYSIEHLWNEKLYQINLIKQVKRIAIPVYFICGRHDVFSSAKMINDFYDQLEAPKGKKLMWFEYSGHEPERDEPEKFYDLMVHDVWKNCLN
jgi:pimeloyl-ACP methyl ester carboxylesterase